MGDVESKPAEQAEDDCHTITMPHTEREVLQPYTDVYQVQDGTVFYHLHCFGTVKLFVKWKGEKVEAKLPAEHIYDLITNETALYFATVVKNTYSIYSAHFTPPDRIVITHLRDTVKGESVKSKGVCIRRATGTSSYVYRLYDDPERDNIRVDVTEDIVKEAEQEGIEIIPNLVLVNLKLIHCHRAIFQIYESEEPLVSEWSEKLIRIKHDTPLSAPYAGWDSSPFIYHAKRNKLFVLDTRSMKFLTGLKFDGIAYINKILSVVEGLITMHCDDEKNKKRVLVTAQLPEGYYKSTTSPDDNAPKEFVSEFLTKFEPFKLLGQGGFGCVFEVRSLADRLRYAVKRIALNKSEVDRALREVQALSLLNHEGIVTFHHSWIEKPPKGWQKRADCDLFKKVCDTDDSFDGCDFDADCVFLYIQMELCKRSLHDWIYANRDRDLARAKCWFKQIVSAVAYIHHNGKIHRDLKPSNILFAEDGRLKVCDLGLVTDLALKGSQEVDATRTVAGTMMYMAPEQYSGKYTSKVDVYSLGLILTELCVRMSLHEAYMVFMKRDMSIVLDHLPEVDRFVAWLTKKEPTERPTCDDILADPFLD